MEIALARLDPDVEVADAARRDVERRLPAPRHVGVEDHGGVRAALVLADPVDDRVAADLLLAVAGDADVHRQRALGGERARPPSAAGRAGPCRRRRRGRRATRPGSSARTAGSPTARAAPAAGRRSGRRRARSARRRRRVDARSSPIASGRSPWSTSSHVAAGARARTRRASRRPRRTSAWCAGSALTLGMRSHSETSASQAGSSGTTGNLATRTRSELRDVAELLAIRQRPELLRLWFSIWRMRSRVTLNARPTSSSVRGCSPFRP